MMDKNLMHYVVVTVIVVNAQGKYLLCKRGKHEKAFASLWTVPGGKMEVLDYALRARDTPEHWYNVLETVAHREVKEEVGLEIESIGYVTSMVYVRSDSIPCLIVSLYAHAASDIDVALDSSLEEYAWVTLEEAKSYDLISGIYEELCILDAQLRRNTRLSWSNTSENKV